MDAVRQPDGHSPRAIALRFAAGELTEEQAIDELGRWPYLNLGRPDEYDGLWEPGEGTWLDVELAHSDGLITDEIYAGALAARLARKKRLNGKVGSDEDL